MIVKNVQLPTYSHITQTLNRLHARLKMPTSKYAPPHPGRTQKTAYTQKNMENGNNNEIDERQRGKEKTEHTHRFLHAHTRISHLGGKIMGYLRNSKWWDNVYICAYMHSYCRMAFKTNLKCKKYKKRICESFFCSLSLSRSPFVCISTLSFKWILLFDHVKWIFNQGIHKTFQNWFKRDKENLVEIHLFTVKRASLKWTQSV